MSDELASFRDLKGVGPAIEARLHKAGVYSWQALAELVDALGSIRTPTGNTLQDLSDGIAERAQQAGAAGPHLLDGERSEAFVVRIALAADGLAARSSVTHVRTQTEKPMAGWSPDELTRFIEEQSGLRQVGSGVAAETATPTAPAAAPAPERTRPASREHTVVLDAGKAIGGARRSLDLVIATDRMAGVEAFEYRATLTGRSYGQAGEPAPAWTRLADQAGHARPPDQLPLRFEGVELPQGMQRLRLELALRLPAARRRAPVLAVAGDPVIGHQEGPVEPSVIAR
jgi:hypothetical protein